MRFYPLKNADGTTSCPTRSSSRARNSTNGYDKQDFVGIIRNVKAAPPRRPEIGFENLDGVPFTDRLVFNRIQVQPPASGRLEQPALDIQPPNNIVHDEATLRIRNTGTRR